MDSANIPPWIGALEEEDLQFIQRFVLASGSLKALAAVYGVSYPTLRTRLDRLIAKISAVDDPALLDPFRRAVQLMVAEGQLAPEQARRLLKAHKESLINPECSR